MVYIFLCTRKLEVSEMQDILGKLKVSYYQSRKSQFGLPCDISYFAIKHEFQNYITALNNNTFTV